MKKVCRPGMPPPWRRDILPNQPSRSRWGVRGENPPTPIEQSGSIGVFVVGLQVDLENWHPVPELRISLQLRLENARVENPGQENPVFGIEIKTTEYIQ
jgi:hypothetical protein